jgi:hypothetical protein
MEIRITILMSNFKLIIPVKRGVNAFLALLAMPGLLVMVSCGTGDDILGKGYPVSGTVTYNGRPLEKGEINFVSEDLTKNFGATGAITNGSYTLSTGENARGAQAGKYKVTISSKEDFVSKARADFQKESGVGGEGKIPPSHLAKASAASKNLIPSGYGDFNTTTLTAEVKAEPNTINFDLSDKDAPPEPKAPPKGRGG